MGGGGTLANPLAVVVDTSNNVYFTTNNQIRVKRRNAGTVQTTAVPQGCIETNPLYYSNFVHYSMYSCNAMTSYCARQATATTCAYDYYCLNGQATCYPLRYSDASTGTCVETPVSYLYFYLDSLTFYLYPSYLINYDELRIALSCHCRIVGLVLPLFSFASFFSY